MNVPALSNVTRSAAVEPGTARAAPAAAAARPATRAAAPFAPSAAAHAARDMAAAPPVDTARVASLKAQIAAGTYTVDPGRIADAMIALDLP